MDILIEQRLMLAILEWRQIARDNHAAFQIIQRYKLRAPSGEAEREELDNASRLWFHGPSSYDAQKKVEELADAYLESQ